MNVKGPILKQLSDQCFSSRLQWSCFALGKTKYKNSIFNPTLLVCSLLLKPMPCWTVCRFRNGQKQGGSKVVSEQQGINTRLVAGKEISQDL